MGGLWHWIRSEMEIDSMVLKNVNALNVSKKMRFLPVWIEKRNDENILRSRKGRRKGIWYNCTLLISQLFFLYLLFFFNICYMVHRCRTRRRGGRRKFSESNFFVLNKRWITNDKFKQKRNNKKTSNGTRFAREQRAREIDAVCRRGPFKC